MKFLTLPAVGAALVYVIFMFATAEVEAQNSEVRCKTPEGQIITIAYPGMCPPGTSPL